jgi:alpha-tubulin suppressor-like RCC1 family protein
MAFIGGSHERHAASAVLGVLVVLAGGCQAALDLDGYRFPSDASTTDLEQAGAGGLGGSVAADGGENATDILGTGGSSTGLDTEGTLEPCAAEDVRCTEAGVPQSCDGEGRWVDGAACEGDTPVCLGGRCVQCAPAADAATAAPRGCLGDTPRRCSDDGEWVLEEPCAARTPRCSSELGQCVECVESADCAWSECSDGQCTRANLVRGGSSGTRCVVLTSGQLACSGSNDLCSTDLLGGGSPDAPGEVSRLELVRGPGGEGVLDGVQDVALGQCSLCALRRGGDVLCWGLESQGALGNGTIASDEAIRVPTPVVDTSGVGTLGDVIGLRGRGDRYCARRSTGDAVCWGSNPNGTLGNGGTADTGVPTFVLGVGGTGHLEPLVDIKADFTSCGVTAEHRAFCWGSDQFGIVAAASTTAVAIPGVDGVGTLEDVEALETGSATCALLGSEQVACWGDNTTGALGRGPTGPSGTSTPGLVLNEAGTEALGSVVQVASAGSHVCALTRTGEVLCWGANGFGQIGQSSTLPDAINLPRKVLGVGGQGTLSDVVSIGVGLGFSCAVRSVGDVVCWGLVIERFNPEYAVITATVPTVLERPSIP